MCRAPVGRVWMPVSVGWEGLGVEEGMVMCLVEGLVGLVVGN